LHHFIIFSSHSTFNFNSQTTTKMLASTIISAFIGSAIVAAAPADLSARQAALICSGTYSNIQCCATDVLGLADLNCANRKH
jgi:hypothetical protein